jgi:pantoate--beta-alanine ligase
MLVLKTLEELRTWRKALPTAKNLGFVPTMGALHAGHLHLVTKSKNENEVTLVSIFVNPMQFAPTDDLNRYPRPFDKDVQLLEAAGVDALFAPSPQHFYAADHSTFCEVHGLDRFLCGASRPGHFRGVCTVVLKLFNLAQPQRAYFGQKDIQQAFILRRMVADLALDIEMRLIATIREESGLALSSRNVYLSEGEHTRATALQRGLRSAVTALGFGEMSAQRLKDLVLREVMSSYPTRIDYIEIVGQNDLQPTVWVDIPCVLAVAVFYGRTRLIDNVLLP